MTYTGATYMSTSDASGRVSTLTNDDGTGVIYEYDGLGRQFGVIIHVAKNYLTVRTVDGGGNTRYLSTPGLPAVLINHDASGRTTDITVDPNIGIDDGGELTLNASDGGGWGGDPSGPVGYSAASFLYDPNGYLASASLSDGLTLQLDAPDASGVVHQTLFGSSGSLLAQTAALGSGRGVRVVPSQLDAVTHEIGLDSDWGNTYSFTTTASGYLTTAFDPNGQPVLYLVDVGGYRVGFDTAGTPLFYDVMPGYEPSGGSNPDQSGVAPSHIVITAGGRTGMYVDTPADGAVYSAWTELDANGNPVQPFAVLDAPTTSVLRTGTESHRAKKKKFTGASEFLRLYQTIVCVPGYCWIHTYWGEWIESGSGGGGGTGGSGGLQTPGSGGRTPQNRGNQINNNPAMRQRVDQALRTAKDKLDNSAQCRGLLDQTGIYAPSTLRDTLRQRGYENAEGVYLTDALRFEAGVGGSSDCPSISDTRASTKPGSTLVKVCPGFMSGPPGRAADYLIHEMLHSLGLPENPPTAGAKTVDQINQEVFAACGS